MAGGEGNPLEGSEVIGGNALQGLMKMGIWLKGPPAGNSTKYKRRVVLKPTQLSNFWWY